MIAATTNAGGISVLISLMALNMFPKDTNRGNAVRHFVWQVALSYFVGTRAAKSIGDAHDWDLIRFGGRTARDSRRDLANNVISRSWYRKHAQDVDDTWQLAKAVGHSKAERFSFFLTTLGLIAGRLYNKGRFAKI
jgi:hypothetical protein